MFLLIEKMNHDCVCIFVYFVVCHSIFTLNKSNRVHKVQAHRIQETEKESYGGKKSLLLCIEEVMIQIISQIAIVVIINISPCKRHA